MFVLDLSIENWNGNKNQEIFLENPNLQQIETEIKQLDGKSKTLLTLGATEDIYMSIGGGQSGQYIVNVTFDNYTFYNLVNPNKIDKIQKLTVGGQQGEYPEKMLIDLATALLASRIFAESGKLEESLFWEKDKSLECSYTKSIKMDSLPCK